MLKIILQFLPILCVYFTEVYCTSYESDPGVWVWPDTFVDDGKPFAEFTCGAYLKSSEWLSWYRYDIYPNKTWFTTIKQQHDGYITIKLLWPLASLKDHEVYCEKQNTTGGLTPSKSIPIKFNRKIEPLVTESESGPWITPAVFLDNGTRDIEFTCYGYLETADSLSWYQKKGEILLGVVQQEAKYGYMKNTLQKILEPSDNGSQIYCHSTYNKTKSKQISITFERHIEALEPYVTVEPKSNVAFFDDGDTLEFVCSGSEPLDGRILTWYLQTPSEEAVSLARQQFYKSINQNRLILPVNASDHRKLLYCTQEFKLPITSNRELARNNLITLLHRAQCYTRELQVTPDKFVDERKPFIQFTCYGFLETGQLITWYQSKGLKKSAQTLPRLIRLQSPRTKGEWTELTLTKTLEQSDNGSEIYCAKHSVLPDGSFSDVLNKTRPITLTFQRDIPSLEVFIRVEPNTTKISFDVNTTLLFVCSGSKPVDGRNYTWFRKDSKSSVTVPEDQKYDASAYQNVLKLNVNESYHLNELYCAQGFLSYIQYNDSSLLVKSYDELVVSSVTTLTQSGEVEKSFLTLTFVGTLALLVGLLVGALAACWALRWRKSPTPAPAPAPAATAGKDKDDNYTDYANISRGMESQEVTYAALDLPKPVSGADRARPAAEQSLYAEIDHRNSHRH